MTKKSIYLFWICGFILLLGLGTVAYFLGWELFFFETDDAYIAYRYVANSIRGWGLTFNPPPFRPVEGYTSFLWVSILHGVWSLLGVKPPQAT